MGQVLHASDFLSNSSNPDAQQPPPPSLLYWLKLSANAKKANAAIINKKEKI